MQELFSFLSRIFCFFLQEKVVPTWNCSSTTGKRKYVFLILGWSVLLIIILYSPPLIFFPVLVSFLSFWLLPALLSFHSHSHVTTTHFCVLKFPCLHPHSDTHLIFPPLSVVMMVFPSSCMTPLWGEPLTSLRFSPIEHTSMPLCSPGLNYSSWMQGTGSYRWDIFCSWTKGPVLRFMGIYLQNIVEMEYDILDILC